MKSVIILIVILFVGSALSARLQQGYFSDSACTGNYTYTVDIDDNCIVPRVGFAYRYYLNGNTVKYWYVYWTSF